MTDQLGDPSFQSMLAIVVPLLVGVLTRSSTSSRVKGLLALALSVVVGVVTALVNNHWQLPTGDTSAVVAYIGTYVGLCIVYAQAAYNMWIKPSGLAGWVQDNVGFTDPKKLSLDEIREITDAMSGTEE